VVTQFSRMRAVGLTVVVALVAAAGAQDGTTAVPKRVTYTIATSGSATSTWSAEGIAPYRGCGVAVTASGSERVSFRTIRPARARAVPNRAGRATFSANYVYPTTSVTVRREGTVRGVVSQAGCASAELIGPTSGCGRTVGTARQAVTLAGDIAAGRVGVHVGVARYRLFPFLERLDPCPSTVVGTTIDHLGREWWQQYEFRVGGGPSEQKDPLTAALPARFWTRTTFSLRFHAERSWPIMVNGVVLGSETLTTSATLTFRRQPG
jgi:hypothetical protein